MSKQKKQLKLFALSPSAIKRFNEEAKKQRLFCKSYVELILEKIAKEKDLPVV